MSEKVETVEVTMKVPKNVVEALRGFILKHDTATEQQYWERQAIQTVTADIDCICEAENLEPMDVIEQYGLLKYYHDC